MVTGAGQTGVTTFSSTWGPTLEVSVLDCPCLSCNVSSTDCVSLAICSNYISALTRISKTFRADEGKRKGKIVAIGEVGLDYARLQFSPKEFQHIGLKAQLTIAAETNLPLYLHNRDSGEDLFRILVAYKERMRNGFIRGMFGRAA